MANVFDYLSWRGDLTLSADPFNNVDALILSQLSYLDFKGIVGQEFDGKAISIRAAAQQFLASIGNRSSTSNINYERLIFTLAECNRYKNMKLMGYVNSIDYESEKQFSAVTILPEDDTVFISYRGTDNTLVGWKEDFNMSFLNTVPSQLEAVKYLEKAASLQKKPLRLGGHSKGGNLAVYASAFCSSEIQNRIIDIYNNDGPGFNEEIISTEGFKKVVSKVRTFIPQSSVVGMLMNHEEPFTIIMSSELGLLQHDSFSWEVMGKDFKCLDNVTSSSRFIDKTLKHWLAIMDDERRGQCIDALYEIFTATGAKTLKELTSSRFKNSVTLVSTLKNIDEPTKELILETLHLLFKSARKSFPMLMSKDE